MKFSFNYKKIVNDAIAKDGLMRPITQEELEVLKSCLFDMAVDLDTRFRKYGIRLFLVYGSLLGAKRHGGFIPWDDDMDFAVTRDDYEKIKCIFNEEFKDTYEIRVPNSKDICESRFMKIYKRGTVLKYGYSNNSHFPEEIFIDIFPCDYVPNNKVHRLIKGLLSNMFMLVSACVFDKKYGDNKKIYELTDDGKLYIALRDILGSVFGFFRPEKWFGFVDRIIRYNKYTSFVTFALGRRHYFGETYPIDNIFPLTEIEFRGHFFYAPAAVESYLEQMYGSDYMVAPPDSERESHFITELQIPDRYKG